MERSEISAAAPLERLARAKAKGLPVVATASINHLSFNELDIGDYRTFCKVVPPLRGEDDRLAVIEALACGATVIASDIPVLREVGGDAVVYCPVAEVSAWATAVLRALADPLSAPPRPRRLAHAAQFSWAAHARVIGETYRRIGRDRA